MAAVDDLHRAKVERMRAEILWRSAISPAAPSPVKAAIRLEALDISLARETYLDAWMVSFIAGRHALEGGLLRDVSLAAKSVAQLATSRRPSDLFLSGFATLMTDGRVGAEPSLRAALNAFLEDQPIQAWLRWGHYATHTACTLWDCTSWDVVSARHVEIARSSGALPALTGALNARSLFAAWCGAFDDAAALVAEENTLKEVTGSRFYSAGELLLAAYQGRRDDTTRLVDETLANAATQGQGQASQVAHSGQRGPAEQLGPVRRCLRCRGNRG